MSVSFLTAGAATAVAAIITGILVGRFVRLPRLDQALSALLSDLKERGMLKNTLVVCMGEFGRAPLVALEPKFAGSSPGRKHWAACYSVVVAGAGVTRGGTVGTSDRFAGYPTSTPAGPWDIAATMFSALGIDPESHYTDAFSRPFPITIGEPIGKGATTGVATRYDAAATRTRSLSQR